MEIYDSLFISKLINNIICLIYGDYVHKPFIGQFALGL